MQLLNQIRAIFYDFIGKYAGKLFAKMNFYDENILTPPMAGSKKTGHRKVLVLNKFRMGIYDFGGISRTSNF